MDEKYTLTMTPETERVMERALEFYARALLGQMRHVCDTLIDSRLSELPAVDSEEHQQAFDNLMKHRDAALFYMCMAKSEIWPTLVGSYGVGHSPECDTAWGVYEVLRYTRSWHEEPEGGITVNFNKPMQWTGEPLPECKVEG